MQAQTRLLFSCRRTDRQPADFANQEDDEVDDVRMDDVLMLDQEPNPEYDLDEEQRPRLSRVSHRLILWKVITNSEQLSSGHKCATAFPKVKKHGITKTVFCPFQP